ncbi:protein of unassigned function [Methylobacterium oryzae CBMB20]|uniref:Protein of unassigned function n=1 Tax=Methylobacterium oryzae CBMB20 TaxID=693986 RepID=A0A089NQA1_9HYPH|nr:protein of unassigned function [Methylobacterium oryzae CBMB20]
MVALIQRKMLGRPGLEMDQGSAETATALWVGIPFPVAGYPHVVR